MKFLSFIGGITVLIFLMIGVYHALKPDHTNKDS